MHYISQRIAILSILVLLASALAAADVKFGTSTISAGFGGTLASGGELTESYGAGPSFTGEYEFALDRFFAATIGLENFFPNVDRCSRAGCSPVRERFTLMPFGLRVVVPLAGDRGEVFVGTGGARLWTTDFNLGGSFQQDKILWHANSGFRIALDGDRRFRLGPTVRLNRDLGRPTQVWLSVTADFSYRFGR